MEQKKITFSEVVNAILGPNRFLAVCAIVGLAIGFGLASGYAYWDKQQLDSKNLVSFQKTAADKYRDIYEAMNNINGDLHARQDICASTLPAGQKSYALLNLKIGRYNNHILLYLNRVRYSNKIFGLEAYEKMKDFMKGLDKIDSGFQSCSPESEKDYAEEVWAGRKIEIERMMYKQILLVNSLRTLKELEAYQAQANK